MKILVKSMYKFGSKLGIIVIALGLGTTAFAEEFPRAEDVTTIEGQKVDPAYLPK